MATWRIDLAYDGGAFKGWARQPGLRTVQAEVESALAIMFGQRVSLTVAGRTDAGVHALAQVASFELPDPTTVAEPRRLAHGLNALTPPEVAILACRPVRDGFDARRDAVSRTYVFCLELGSPPSPLRRGRVWNWPYRLDRDALDACAAATIGRHDFTAFTPTKTDHVRFDRVVHTAEWSVGDSISEKAGVPGAEPTLGFPPVIEFTIEADAFMRNMVRILVGTMVDFASSADGPERFAALLEGASRSAAGQTAPPAGLFLAGVRYGEAGERTLD